MTFFLALMSLSCFFLLKVFSIPEVPFLIFLRSLKILYFLLTLKHQSIYYKEIIIKVFIKNFNFVL